MELRVMVDVFNSDFIKNPSSVYYEA